MKKTEALFVGSFIGVIIALFAGVFDGNKTEKIRGLPDTKYGAFLAAQHAIYVNDFDAAAKYSAVLDGADATVVKNAKIMSDFLSGRLPDKASELDKESGTPARLIYDAYLVEQGNWEKLYARHKNDNSALVAPLRIWASAAINHRTEILKFVDSLDTNSSWKAFVRGQIYVENGDVDKAAAEFANVHVDFMNINDYQYLMSFYLHHDMLEDAKILREDFTSRPAGLFMLDYKKIPEWSHFTGYKNALAFSLIQSVSHTQVMMYSDLSILLLRFAQIITPENDNTDAITYYIGQYFFSNNGDYHTYFLNVSDSSPFYLFANLRECEQSGDIKKLKRLVHRHPLFMPAVNKLVAHYVANGDKNSALGVLQRTLDNKDLNDAARGFLLKSRAQVYFAFGDTKKAQSDVHDAYEMAVIDGEIMALQAKIWAAENRELDVAYEYAMKLVRVNPSDVFAWDVLGRVIAVSEGAEPALELLERVGEMAKECSSLFENLGDLYAKTGNIKKARDAYMRAIELSGDGLVVAPNIERKIRKLK